MTSKNSSVSDHKMENSNSRFFKSDSLVTRLKSDLVDIHQKCHLIQKEYKQKETDMNKNFHHKLENYRQMWQLSKQKDIENISNSIRNDYEQRMNILLQSKDKELKYLRNQLCMKSNSDSSSSIGSSTFGSQFLVGLLNSTINQDFLKNSKSQDMLNCSAHRKSKLPDVNDLKLLVVQLRNKILQLEKNNRLKDYEILNLKKHQNMDDHRTMSLNAKNHIRALLEEIRQKDKQIAKLETSLKSTTHELTLLTSADKKEEASSMLMLHNFTHQKPVQSYNESELQANHCNDVEDQIMNSTPDDNVDENIQVYIKETMQPRLKDSDQMKSKRAVNRRKKHSNRSDFDIQSCLTSPSLETILEDYEDNEATVTNIAVNDDVTSDSIQSGTSFECYPTDMEWACEKLKYASLVESLRVKIADLEKHREKVETELQEVKEENELLEFKLLEVENSSKQNAFTTGCSHKIVCDQSVCTSDDEGFKSLEESESSGEEQCEKLMPKENVKLNFILLKQLKELSPENKNLISRVKSIWENLENQHYRSKMKELALEMKLRENDAAWKVRFDSLKENQVKCELQQIVNQQSDELESCKQRIDQLMNDLQLQAKKMKEQENEIERLKRINLEYQESLNCCRKIEERLSRKVSDVERKYEDVKQKFRESLKIIHDYEVDDAKYAEKIKTLSRSNHELTEELEKLANLTVELRENSSMWEQKCFKLERSVENLNRDLRLKSDLFLCRSTYQKSPVVDQNPSTSKNIQTNKLTIFNFNGDLNETDSMKSYFYKEYIKIQKQLCQLKSYCWHMENQFEFQIRLVEILKDQIISMKKCHPVENHDKAYNADQIDRQQDMVQELFFSMPKTIESVPDWMNFKQKIETFASSNDNYLCKLLPSMIAESEENQIYQIATTSDDILPKNQRDKFNQKLTDIKSKLTEYLFHNQKSYKIGYSALKSEIKDQIVPFSIFKSFPKNSNVGQESSPQTFSPSPPQVAQIVTELQDHHYVIVWDPPMVLSGVAGYKVYINDEILKMISDPHCTTTVVQCLPDQDMKSMWMVSYGTGAESESECESSRIRIEVNFDRFHRFSRNLAVIRLQINNDADDNCEDSTEV